MQGKKESKKSVNPEVSTDERIEYWFSSPKGHWTFSIHMWLLIILSSLVILEFEELLIFAGLITTTALFLGSSSRYKKSRYILINDHKINLLQMRWKNANKEGLLVQGEYEIEVDESTSISLTKFSGLADFKIVFHTQETRRSSKMIIDSINRHPEIDDDETDHLYPLYEKVYRKMKKKIVEGNKLTMSWKEQVQQDMNVHVRDLIKLRNRIIDMAILERFSLIGFIISISITALVLFLL